MVAFEVRVKGKRICIAGAGDLAVLSANATASGMLGQAVKAVLEEANAIMCASSRWVCNEKRLIDSAGLTGVQALFGEIPSEPAGVVRWIDLVADKVGVPQGEVMPWNDAGRSGGS